MMRGYIAVVPELRGCSAFGEIEEEALEEVKIAIELWLEIAKKPANTSHNPAERNFLRESLKKLFAPCILKELVHRTSGFSAEISESNRFCGPEYQMRV